MTEGETIVAGSCEHRLISTTLVTITIIVISLWLFPLAAVVVFAATDDDMLCRSNRHCTNKKLFITYETSSAILVSQSSPYGSHLMANNHDEHPCDCNSK